MKKTPHSSLSSHAHLHPCFHINVIKRKLNDKLIEIEPRVFARHCGTAHFIDWPNQEILMRFSGIDLCNR